MTVAVVVLAMGCAAGAWRVEGLGLYDGGGGGGGVGGGGVDSGGRWWRWRWGCWRWDVRRERGRLRV